LGRRKALANLGFPNYIFSVLKSIANNDSLNPEGTGRFLSLKDMFGIRNLRSSLQTQIDNFFVKIKNLADLLSKIFPNTTMKSTVGLIVPVSGLTDLEMAFKNRVIYNSLGTKLGLTPENITFYPTSLTTCKINLGPTNGDSATSSAYVFINNQSRPLYENKAEERISDFDSVTVEWEEQQQAGQPPIKKQRTNMQVNGPFFSTYDFWESEFKTVEKLGSFIYELDLVRGSGDSFEWLLANGATATNCKIVKKVSRKFKCYTDFLIPASQIASVQRTNNLTTVVLKSTFDYLGDPNLAIDNPADDRIVRNQPIVVRATGPLADFSGAYRLFSVDRRNRIFTYQNVSSTESSTVLITNPNIEISVFPFYSEKFRQGESINLTILDHSTKIPKFYKDLIVGEDVNDGNFKGFYLYGKDDVNYSVMYHFENAFSWGNRQAGIINNFPNTKLQAGARAFTARQFIRGYSSASMPSVQHGDTFGTSTRSLWNRITRNQSGIVMGISFPGEVQINGSLEIQRMLAFGTGSALVKNPVLGEGSVISPFYEYFNKEKELTHFFRLKIGAVTGFLPANTFEEQVFKHNREVESRGATLEDVAVVALDKFYTAGNKFVFAGGGTLKSSANQFNVFFGDIFQPLLRITSPVTSNTYKGRYANVSPAKPGMVWLRTIPATSEESQNVQLNKYYAAMAGPNFENATITDDNLSPTQNFNWSFNAIVPKQTNIFDPTEDLQAVIPTNKNTIILVFRFRTDWAENRPTNGAVADENTPQVLMGQGIDFQLLQTRFPGQTSDIFFRDNGLGWLLYSKNYTEEDREIFFTNPGPFLNMVNNGSGVSYGGTASEPTRVPGFDANVVLPKKFKTRQWYFLAMTFKTTENDGTTIMSDINMQTRQTATPALNFYLNGQSGFAPTQTFLNDMRQTEVSFFIGQGTDQIVAANPSQNSMKIIRGFPKMGTNTNRYGRTFGVGLPLTENQFIYEKSGYSNKNFWQGAIPIPSRSHPLYRVSCPIDVAFLAQISDVASQPELLQMYKSLRNGTFKDFGWGNPV